MSFTKPDLPDVDLETFEKKPHLERMKILSQHWAEYGFGTPWAIPLLYVVKIALYVFLGVVFASFTSGFGGFWDVASFWTEPIFYQKMLLWTMLFEVLGLGASSGPLAFRFTPPIGGMLHFARPKTLRMPPWPGKVPFTRGSARTWFDVALYLGIVANLVILLLSDGVTKEGQPADSVGLLDPRLLWPLIVMLVVIGLRDKIVFLIARSEQYWVAAVFFAVLPYVDMIVALKLIVCTVWFWAAFSKLGRHFSFVVTAMLSNAPWLRSPRLKRKLYRNFPDDLRPSKLAAVVAHQGTVIEFAVPVILLFSTNRTLTLVTIAGIVFFHLVIASMFPLAVPLEWNIFYCFSAVWLFGLHMPPEFGVTAVSPLLLALLVGGLFLFPILGNFRPDKISFLPSMRYYAGNWATTQWAFRKGTESRLNTHIVKAAPTQIDQLTPLYGREVGEILLQKTVAWRSLHSQGRALSTLIGRNVDSYDNYDIREGELVAGALLGWQFGDGHVHNEQFMRAIQERCGFAPGEVIVAYVESQPIHVARQEYRVYDLALGEIERGYVKLSDIITPQPWLESGPVPVTSTRTEENSSGWSASVQKDSSKR
ncbi:DUF3556 domain-containing protein [Rhodococcus xishaensis]|uniref:DUF3556 domain-containing protein n=1 Tax=Rhodococcus xishaensis TaxID=2487364 RepID=A0A438AVZ8_9NOCA|nr:DUF3556 domain-containing protein [Rhodococcus xishaensis]RVW02835.1 DUF3556 domain-containing protein [Rhodococcus xishaensis]